MLLALLLAGWIGTWAAPPTSAQTTRSFAGTTLREPVRVSVGGSQVRVRLTNRFGTGPLTIGAASVAAAAGLRRLTFAGTPAVTIAPGADALSDPVALDVGARSTLQIMLYVTAETGGATMHHNAYRHIAAAAGDHTGEPVFDGFAPAGADWYFLAAVDVVSPARRAVAVLGDSIASIEGAPCKGRPTFSTPRGTYSAGRSPMMHVRLRGASFPADAARMMLPRSGCGVVDRPRPRYIRRPNAA